jgi:hypothetical protein
MPGLGIRALSPASHRSKQLQSNRKLIATERFAIDHSCACTETPRQGAHIQALVRFPWLAGNHASAVGAHVFRDGFLRSLTDIQATKVYSDLERETFV